VWTLWRARGTHRNLIFDYTREVVVVDGRAYYRRGFTFGIGRRCWNNAVYVFGNFFYTHVYRTFVKLRTDVSVPAEIYNKYTGNGWRNTRLPTSYSGNNLFGERMRHKRSNRIVPGYVRLSRVKMWREFLYGGPGKGEGEERKRRTNNWVRWNGRARNIPE